MTNTTYQRACSGYYQSNLTVPRKPSKPIWATLDGMKTSDEAFAFAERLKSYEAAIVEWNSANAAYRADSDRLEKQFWDDLSNEYDTVRRFGHAGSVAIGERAWDRGHSAGHSEVASIYGDLIDFAESIKQSVIGMK